MHRDTVKKSIGLLCVLIALATTYSPLILADCNKELVNGWGGDWEPFLTGTYDKPGGLDIEILDAVISASGCRWKNTALVIPWARHLGLIKLGRLDIATGASWTEERDAYAYFTKPYRSEYVALFVRKNDLEKYASFPLHTLFSKLNGIGVEQGNSYGKDVDTLLKSIGEQAQTVNNNDQNIQKLLGKRIDAYLGFLPYDAMLIKKMEREDKIEMLPLSVVKTGNIHFMLSKTANSEAIFQALESGLAEIKKNGSYKRIIKKYSDKYGVSYW